jgi:hypothetical protein
VKNRTPLSDCIHECLVTVLQLPPDKKFQRFIALDEDDFIFPSDRSKNYTVLEIVLFSGRSPEAKKAFIRRFYEQSAKLGFEPNDLELVFLESGRENWGIRGLPADELTLSYKVDLK